MLLYDTLSGLHFVGNLIEIRSSHFSAAKINIIQRKLDTIIGYILKSISVSSDSFFWITSHIFSIDYLPQVLKKQGDFALYVLL